MALVTWQQIRNSAKHIFISPDGHPKMSALSLFVFILGFLFLGNTLKLPFISDDYVYLFNINTSPFWSMWGKAYSMLFFRPMVDFTFWLDFKLWGFQAWGFHLTNLLLHITNALLVVYLGRRLFIHLGLGNIKSSYAGLSAGIVFLVLPSHPEAMSWISGRNDLLLALFAILTLIALDLYITRPSWRSLFFFSSATLAALLSKESAVIIPLLVLGWSAFSAFAEHDTSIWKRMLLPFILSAILVFAFFLFRQSYLHHWIGGYGSSIHLKFSPGLIISNILIAPIRSIILPFSSFFSSIAMYRSLRVVFAIFYLLLFALVFVKSRKRSDISFPALASMFSLFYLAYLPNMNLFLNLYGSYGERYLYLSSVFLSWTLITLGILFVQNISLQKIAFSLIICFCVFGFHSSNHNWFVAGALSDRLVKEAIELNKKDNLLVLNLPDNYRGAFIFHNGFPEAVSLAKYLQTKGMSSQTSIEPDRSKVQLLKTHDIHSPFEKVSLTFNGSTATLGVLGTTIPLSLPSLEDDCDIAYFTSGSLKPAIMP